MIELINVSLRRGTFELRQLNLTIPTGTYAALLGPSGSGKTTILESLAGLLPARSGIVKLRNDDATDWPPAARNIAYVPQDLVLFPKMTVKKNLLFPLTVQGIDQEQCEARLQEISDSIELSSLLNRKAHSLSRGQAQRVAVGRAFMMRTDILLMDEPLNSLDLQAVDQIRDVTATLHQKYRPTILHVAHDRRQLPDVVTAEFEINEGSIQAIE